MGGTMLTPATFILFISAIFQFQTPEGGLANISITTELLLFIIPAIAAQFIFLVVKMVQMTVQTGTWEKVMKHAKKAMVVASFFELIAAHAMVFMALSDDNYWVKFISTLLLIGIEGLLFALILVDRFYYATK